MTRSSLASRKVALLLFGQARFADLGAAHFKMLLESQDFEVDVFFHTWSKTDTKNVAPWVSIRPESLLTIEKLIPLLNPRAFATTNHIEMSAWGFSESQVTASQKSSLWIHCQMFYSIFQAIDLFCTQDDIKSYDQVIVSRFDFRPQTWRLANVLEPARVYHPKLNHKGQLSDWALAMNIETIFRIHEADHIFQEVLIKQRDELSGEKIWTAVLRELDLDKKSFTSGGFLVRDQALAVRWGRFDWRATPLPFILHEIAAYIQDFLNLATNVAKNLGIRKSYDR